MNAFAGRRWIVLVLIALAVPFLGAEAVSAAPATVTLSAQSAPPTG